MKIEDCEVGKKLKKIKEIPGCFVKKDEIVKVSEIINKTVFVENKDGKELAINIKNYAPVNKFKVGDEVVYYNKLFKVWGYVYNNIIKKYNYALKNDDEEVTIAIESQLSPLKKKDELEAGDKFRNKFYEFRIIFVAYDDFYNKKKYICKINDTGSKGLIQTMFPEDIKEIIYE